jgi:hypothetical protein
MHLVTFQAIALALVLSTASGAVGSEATVSGTVTDSTGSESAHALVQALRRVKSKSSGTVGDHPNPWIQTDSHG